MAANTNRNSRYELTATTWWIVDLTHRPRLKVGATPLVDRSMRIHGWDEGFALRVLEGYRKFLNLKQMFQDYDSEKLSPSIPVEQMWHLHILDTENYERDCRLLFGRMIQHNPDERLDDPQARKKRIAKTIFSVRLKFDDMFDKEVWDYGTHAAIRERPTNPLRDESREADQKRQTKRPRPSDDKENEPDAERSVLSGESLEGSTTNEQSLTIRIRDTSNRNQGEDLFFTLKETSPMGDIFFIMGSRMGEASYRLKFFIDGCRISPEDTPQSLGLRDDDIVHMLYELAGVQRAAQV